MKLEVSVPELVEVFKEIQGDSKATGTNL